MLKGNAIRLDVTHSWSDGILYGKDLNVQDCRINHNGSNKMELNVSNSLKGSINSIGSVYLFGQNPALIEVEITDDGQLIEKY